jgi:uncharacterized membrane protein YgcG
MRAPGAWAAPTAVAMLATLAALSATAVRADERILGFDSDIRIDVDGGMTVTETIRVAAEGIEIRRGIYRDFPTDYRDTLGNRYRVEFEVTRVLRDGRPEPYFTERLSNGVRVYIGDRDTLLPAGEHVYTLSYETDRQLGFFPDHDELYWNVTGNGWGFPIDRASARVTLPATVGRDALTMEGYVGVQGSRERSYEAAIEGPSSATIATTRPLAPNEGLTLVMTWPKGVVAEPTAAERTLRLLTDNVGLLIAFGVLLATLFYLVRVWRAHGRDPEAGVIFPHYEPPGDVSPAGARYVARMRYDSKAFSAAIINLAVKGFLQIDEHRGKYTLRATGLDPQSTAAGARPAAGERALLEALFADGPEVVLENKNHRTMRAAMRAHTRALKRENDTIYFVTNPLYVMPAIALIAIGGVAIAVLGAFNVLFVVVLVVTALLLPLFKYLLKAPTRIGRRLLDKIEGFKLYLDVAEKDELNLRNPPEKTPELFEAYLPYALALGVEQRWAERFSAVFARVHEQTGTAYQPLWYHGRWDTGRLGHNVGRMTTKMTSAVTSAIAAASTPPGSSSGSGGGGSSGGGGGGGGGGGW